MNTREKIKVYYDECVRSGRRPTVREVARHVGVISTNTAHYHMKKLGIPPRNKIYNSKYGNNVVVLRKKVVELLGGTCAVCGYGDIRALQIDHVKSNGAEHRNLRGGNRGVYIDMIDELESGKSGDYQILCANCNSIKKHERGEWGGGRGGKWNDSVLVCGK